MSEKTARNRKLVRLYESGDWTMAALGDRYGISTERVRQIVRREGVEGRPDLEKRREERITDCAVCGEQFDPRHRYYCKTCSPKCGAILTKRRVSDARTIWTAQKALDALVELAVELGHTPSSGDLNDSDDAPYHMTYVHIWGSMAAAQKAAGLIPNERGHPPKPLPPRLKEGA